MRSLYDNTVVLGHVAVFSTSNAVVAVGPSVDSKGYNTGALRVRIGALGAGLGPTSGSTLSAILQESSDNVTFTTANDNGGTAIGFTGTSATVTAVVSDARIEGLGLSNRKRYLRVQLTANQATSGVIANSFTAIAVLELGRGYNNPVNTTTSNT